MNASDAARRFVLELGRAMHALGSPSYRVEDAMEACARSLGMQGGYFATPTAIFASLGPIGGEPQTVLLRVQPGENDLGKLAALYAVRDAVVRGTITAEAGLARLTTVLSMPPTTGPVQALPAFGLGSATAAVFLGGSLVEMLAAAAIGLVVGALALLAARMPRFRRVFEPAACAGAAFATYGAARLAHLDPGTVILASVIALLPGLVFTNALAELAMRHLAAGSARLLGAGATMLTMAVGVGLGARVGTLTFGAVAPHAHTPLPTYWQVPATLAAAFAYAVLLRARRTQFPAVLVAVLAAFAGTRLGNLWFERELAAFVGALLVAAAANLYARWFRGPAAVLRTPGLLLLVPGSLGFRGFTTALQQDFAAGAQFAFQMLLVGGALVAGLLVASVLLPPPLDIEPDSAG